MELDDLRRQWQQSEPVAFPTRLTTAELTQLVVQRSGSILAKLRRNARLELGVNYALLLSSLTIAVWAPVFWLRLFGGLLALIAGVCIYYFYRKLGLIRTMDEPADDLRGHLLRITRGLRSLVQLYYRLTLATIPVTMLVCGLIALHESPKLRTPLQVGLVLGAMQLLSILLYLPIKYTTMRYLQRLYGQHLDRLEGQLRELEEEIPAVGPLPAQS
ncbi:hypothetical protein [Hymenobacter psoromatis]|uniref:hypothetical protein n=1 Tax=Hymenobacter psoromatis TaxID=1484116 RepID=UPI001CBA7F01|nr:hypothetical protein [Hymenobacter psoromatis]